MCGDTVVFLTVKLSQAYCFVASRCIIVDCELHRLIAFAADDDVQSSRGSHCRLSSVLCRSRLVDKLITYLIQNPVSLLSTPVLLVLLT
jgi:hypothetical protein